MNPKNKKNKKTPNIFFLNSIKAFYNEIMILFYLEYTNNNTIESGWWYKIIIKLVASSHT